MSPGEAQLRRWRTPCQGRQGRKAHQVRLVKPSFHPDSYSGKLQLAVALFVLEARTAGAGLVAAHLGGLAHEGCNRSGSSATARFSLGRQCGLLRRLDGNLRILGMLEL